MARRPGRRDRIRAAFDELHDLACATLGAAEELQTRAARRHAETMAELWLREVGYDEAHRDPALRRVLEGHALSDVVERVRADRHAAVAPWLARGAPDEFSALVAGAAPGAAGDDPGTWLGSVGTVEGNGAVPGLWQIGQACLDGGDPFPVGVPLLDESHLQVTSTPATRTRAEDLVQTLLTRVLSYFRPGLVSVHVWDVGQVSGSLPGLYPLTRTGLLTVHDPTRPGHLLDQLSDRIRRVHTRVLVDGHPSLRALAESTGQRSEPWTVAVLLGNGAGLPEQEHRQLQRVARGGPACGISLVLLDVPVALSAAVESVTFSGGAGEREVVRSSMTGSYLRLDPDPGPANTAVNAAASAIADAHEQWRGRLGAFAELLPPGSWGEHSSAHGVYAPIGFEEGRPVEVGLDDATPHALLGGPSGSGKTNLLLTWISAMAARYPPTELELYMLDFKEGVSFAQFAPGRHSRKGLPQARLVGININTDREFGLALLRFLAEEMRRRAEAAKHHEVTKLAELRDLDPEGRWPRIVAVIDEFQYLFAESDAVTKEATRLLEDVARRGRSQGIHLVLASQDVAGIEAFWGRPAIFEQFVLRIALPRARRVLADLNDAALEIPRWHAVVNGESGMRHGNQVARVPDATTRAGAERTSVVDEVRARVRDAAEQLHAAGPLPGRPPPDDPDREIVVFDGTRAPQYTHLVATLQTVASGVPTTLVGQAIDVAGTAAVVDLPDSPGRNLAVIAAGTDDAVRVLGSAACALGERGAGARFLVASLVPDADPAAEALVRELDADDDDRCDELTREGFRARVEDLAEQVRKRLAGDDRTPVYLVLFGADAADALLERAGTEALRTVLHFGPEVGVHTLGWWRSPQRLRSLLSIGASMDDLGAWVALDVQGSELSSFAPGLGLAWSPRPGRGLFFDRAHHSRPQVVFVPEWPGAAGPVPPEVESS
ncbi:MAG: cell division protein FtsK [Pseudonocardia sp.]|nr:cell division protein FtsK [Pseudonocardia sp.]